MPGTGPSPPPARPLPRCDNATPSTAVHSGDNGSGARQGGHRSRSSNQRASSSVGSSRAAVDGGREPAGSSRPLLHCPGISRTLWPHTAHRQPVWPGATCAMVEECCAWPSLQPQGDSHSAAGRVAAGARGHRDAARGRRHPPRASRPPRPVVSSPGGDTRCRWLSAWPRGLPRWSSAASSSRPSPPPQRQRPARGPPY